MIYTKEKLEKLQHRWTTTQGKRLIKKIKETHCYLSPVLFKQAVKNFPYIKDEEVSDGIDLRGINLSGFDFRIPIQEDDDGFSEEIAIFSNIHFEGATLKHCNFQDGKIHDCFFEDADLSHSDFKNATLNNCNFQEADLTGVNFLAGKLISCSFIEASIKDMTTASTIVDQKTDFGKYLKSEKSGNYHFAAIEYKQIKEMYKNSSLHEQADEYHYREMVTKRKTLALKNPMRIIGFIFGDLISKYGTSSIRVILTGALVILLSAALFTLNNSLLFQNKPVDGAHLSDSLYFSMITFTTVGYGDYHAIGLTRFVAATESFIGVILMSLFTIIVARKIIRD